MRFRTAIEISRRNKSLGCLSLTNVSSTCGVVFVRRGIFSSPGLVFNRCLSESWMSACQLLKLSRNGICLMPEFSQDCSVSNTECCCSIPFGGDGWLYTAVCCFFSKSWVSWIVSNAESCSYCLACFVQERSPEVFARQLRRTVEVLLRWSLICHMQFRSEDLAFPVKRQFGLFHPSYFVCLPSVLTLSHRSSIPRRWCVCCLGSKKSFLCGVVRFATELTGWVHSSGLLSFRLFALWIVVILAFLLSGLEYAWLLLLLLFLPALFGWC